MVYCTYNMLNMFRALLCPLSGARDYMCVISAVWCAMPWLLEVRCRAAGYASRKRDVAGVRCLGCWRSGTGKQAMRPGRGMLLVCDALVAGGQVQGSRLCVREEGCCWCGMPWLLEVRCREAGYASGKRDVAPATSLFPDA
jgi:hypothetical protein